MTICESGERTDGALQPVRQLVRLGLEISFALPLVTPDHTRKPLARVGREELLRAPKRIDQARRSLEPLIDRFFAARLDRLFQLLKAEEGHRELGVPLALDRFAVILLRGALLLGAMDAALATAVRSRRICALSPAGDDCGQTGER